MEKMQLYPIWKHNIKPEYSFQQIEPTGKSSDVLNIQWHFFLKKCPGVIDWLAGPKIRIVGPSLAELEMGETQVQHGMGRPLTNMQKSILLPLWDNY